MDMTTQLSSEQIGIAKWVAELIHADNATNAFVEAYQSGNNEFFSDGVEAYMAEVGRRIEKIQTTYLTNPEAMQAMRLLVLAAQTNHQGE
jgi:hypothetical protein